MTTSTTAPTTAQPLIDRISAFWPLMTDGERLQVLGQTVHGAERFYENSGRPLTEEQFIWGLALLADTSVTLGAQPVEAAS